MDEINHILDNDITPTLDRLRGEKTHYLKWAANDAEEQRLNKFCVAYAFVQAEAKLSSSDGERQQLENKQAELLSAQKDASVRPDGYTIIWIINRAGNRMFFCYFSGL